MPDVHFIGEIEDAANEDFSLVSVTFAFVPGSSAWFLKGGVSYGETHAVLSSPQDCLTLNYPLDVHYETSSSEGWPFFVCELWDKSSDGARNFIGCGGAWLPQSGTHSIDVCLWRPSSVGLDSLSETMLPTCPDLRSQIQADSAGTVRVKVTVVTIGFEAFGCKL
jgi:hypothetical protein